MSEARTDPRVSDLTTLDLNDSRHYRSGFPHALFSRLRHEAPVWWQSAPAGFQSPDPGFWVLSKYADVVAANRDSELFGAIDGPSLADQPEMRGAMLASMDGREHARQRRLISAGFTPRMVARLEEGMRRWAASIVDRALESGTCDFVQDVAYQLPMHVIADIVGIPVDDRQRLFALANDFVSAGDADAARSPEQQLAIQLEMFGYARALGEEKRAHPEDDVWTILSTVEIDSDDGGRTKLGDIELDFFFLLLTVAGSETTRNAIAGGLMALVDHPDQMESLRRAGAVPDAAVDEILRWSSPVSYFARRANRDTEMRGVPIAAGDRVTLWYPSANRDEDVFADPFRFDISRVPNEHVAFGGGGHHFCLGANLARREIAVLFEELLRRTQRIEIASPPVYSALGIYSPILVAPKALQVRLS